MKIITLEEHYTTPMYLEATAASGQGGSFGSGGASDSRMQAIQRKTADLGDECFADMDAAGIDVQAPSLSGILSNKFDSATATAIARDANDRAAEAVRVHPTRFAPFAALDLKDPKTASEELKQCVGEFGFKGAMADGMTDGLFLDDARFLPVFETAQSLGVPIYLHPAPPPESVRDACYSNLPDGFGQMLSIAGWGWHIGTGLHSLRLIVSGIFDKLPELQIVIRHMGENLPFSVARAERVLSNAPKPLARPVTEYFQSNFHVTTSGCFTLPPFLCALMVVEADRLMFSAGYPFSTNDTGRAFLDSLPVSAADEEKIAHGNAERLLNL